MSDKKPDRINGILAPVLTPFGAGLLPDHKRFIDHCKWLISNGCGITPFGTTSEGNSLSVNEKSELLDSLLNEGIDPSRVMPGTGGCSLIDTVELTRNAVRHGCAGVLVLPPFYYKQITEDGLFAYFSELIERVGEDTLRVYLYHIPPVAVICFSQSLVARLIKRYPGAIAGMKDSSGDWANTRLMLDSFASDGFDVFVGSETFLLENMRNGGRGCISATANVNPVAIVGLYENWQSHDAEQRQQELNKVRSVFGRFPMIPALKAAVASFTGEKAWNVVRPPLDGLTTDEIGQLMNELNAIKFRMQGNSAGDNSKAE